jgi:hypothetical protein
MRQRRASEQRVGGRQPPPAREKNVTARRPNTTELPPAAQRAQPAMASSRVEPLSTTSLLLLLPRAPHAAGRLRSHMPTFPARLAPRVVRPKGTALRAATRSSRSLPPPPPPPPPVTSLLLVCGASPGAECGSRLVARLGRSVPRRHPHYSVDRSSRFDDRVAQRTAKS